MKICTAALLAASSLLFACAGQISMDDDVQVYKPVRTATDMDDLMADPARAPRDVTIWVDDHEDVDREEVLRGCEAWLPAGMTCSYANVREDAIILVETTDTECVPDENGASVVAWGGFSNGWGNILFVPSCFSRNEDGTVVVGFVQSATTHETGHTIGLDHVTASCEDVDPDNPLLTGEDGEPICGTPTIMNPLINWPLVFDIGDLDLRAFDVRREGAVEPRADINKATTGHACSLAH